MNKAIKYRVYPTTQQADKFAQTFGCCRKVWNLMLTDKIAYYKATGKSLQTTPARYKKDYTFLKEVDSLALANVQINLQSSYKAFFDKKGTSVMAFLSSSQESILESPILPIIKKVQ